ncbi:tudor domain-containing protein 1 [Parambassis ranga]|uniref:Tudor domain-containing protein 1 n=1 Tax=Parambassis ranga TaxID=210632 RepID=A0A6P7K9K7_9TELE|nr:tudor domain-containing protein 1 [Parambassis ranga]
MNRPFSQNMVHPHPPLRQPASNPTAPSTGVRPAPPLLSGIGDGLINPPASINASSLMGSAPPALAVFFCNYCAHQGHFRCKRCKSVAYCSVACQSEDWKAHRHLCKPSDAEPQKGISTGSTSSPVKGDGANPLELKRVCLTDLPAANFFKGSDIQASLVEFYNPGRFFLVAQSPELLEALQRISTELQKTYSTLSVMSHIPFVGEVCAVQFSCDMNWYRGLVQTFSADQKMASILYIDFGNEENVPVNRIRPLATNIPLFCPCAMECCIAGVVPVVGKWSGECCFAVRQMLAGKTVTVRLMETPENGCVHAVDILLSVGKPLSTFLIENGYAVEKTVNITPTEQDIVAMLNASFENFRCLSNGKDDNTWAQPPEPLTVTVGDQLSVIVTHFQSPTELIVQKVENAGVIQDLQLKLREHCSQVADPQSFRPAPGTVCCAQFSEDKQWYRAKVLAYSSKERVCVGYIDFGNSEDVDIGHLQPISQPLLAQPMQAIPCGLAGVQPIGESWSEECLLAMQQRVSNRILHIEIQKIHEGKALVTMLDESSDPQANVAELLISAGYAAAGASSNHEQADVTAASPKPQVSEPLVWKSAELPCGGQTVALLTSFVDGPGEFYCHISNAEDQQRLSELGNQLRQHCEADSSSFVPKMGEPCCAMFPGDGAWYRVMVNGVFEDTVAVNFVDYGYCMEVQKSHLRAITPQLLTLPFQAVRCWLTGVEPQGSEWSSETLLLFQTLVDGKEFSARVLSKTEQGYGVDLDSKGENVAACLISQQLSRVPGEIANETHAKTGCGSKQKETEHCQLHIQTSTHIKAISEEIPAKEQTAPQLQVSTFPVDWKTMELPLNTTFKPYIAAVTSPSLFYLLGPSQVNQTKLQEVMMELAVYCRSNQASLSSSVKSKPAPGAACCAQFTADNAWYRAVVLEVCDNEMSVIYADYGNCEKVHFSRIMPIPMHLLQLPFQITRCTLAGKALSFPSEWSEKVRQLFKSTLTSDILATVQSFDGSANVLSLTLPTEMGGGDLTAMILDELYAQTERNACSPTTQESDITGSSTSISTAAAPDCSQPVALPDCHGPETVLGPVSNTVPNKTPEPTDRTCQQKESTSLGADPVKIINQMKPKCQNISNTNVPGPQTTGCCCLNTLTTKIDQVEQLMQLQLSLIQQLIGQKK